MGREREKAADGAKFHQSYWRDRTVQEIGNYPPTFHVRDILDCVKTLLSPRGTRMQLAMAHIACHAANIAILLNRQVKFDFDKREFLNDDAANRCDRSVYREPWRI